MCRSSDVIAILRVKSLQKMEKQAKDQIHTTEHSKLNAAPVSRNSFLRRMRKWSIRIIASTFGLIIALTVCELGLRIIGVSYPLPYQADPYCGTKLQPHFSALFTKEGRAYVQTTSDGRRDREYSKQKAANVFRIAVLGDSYAEALQVEQPETFWSVLQRELQTCEKLQGKQLEVLNFGVSGFGTAQELQMLEHYVWEYQPDIVLLAFLTGNDISDNSAALSTNRVRPFYQLENEQLVLDESFREHPTYLAANSTWGKLKTAWINRSRLLQLMRESWNRVQESRSHSTQEQQPERGLDAIYSPPQSTEWNEAWDITERILLRMNEMTRERGCLFCVVTLSNALQVDPHAEKRAQMQQAAKLEHLFYPDFRVVECGIRNGFPVFPLAPAMQKEAERTQTYFHGFSNTHLGMGHWNRDGHQFAGEFLASEICEWLPSMDSPD